MTRAKPYNREAALQAAMTLFWRKGFHATSLKDLEQALSMKPGSIYAAFESKEKLFALALERYRDGSQADLRAVMEAAETPLDGLADFVRGMAAPRQPERPCRACMLVKTVLEIGEDASALGQAARDYLSAIEGAFAAVFEQLRAQGVIARDSDPERLARRLQSNIFGLRVFAQRAGNGPETRQLAEDIASEILALRIDKAA